MSGSSEALHEPPHTLTDEVREFHRACTSLQEELEAVDAYRQRMTVCRDGELRAILGHNMREEMEHAAMLLEWLRQQDGDLDARLREQLSGATSSSGADRAAQGAGALGDPAAATLGSLK